MCSGFVAFGGLVVCWLWRSGVGGGLFGFVIPVLLFAYVIWFNSVGYNWFFGGCWFIVFWLWCGVMIASFLGFELIAVVVGYLWVVWFGFGCCVDLVCGLVLVSCIMVSGCVDIPVCLLGV